MIYKTSRSVQWRRLIRATSSPDFSYFLIVNCQLSSSLGSGTSQSVSQSVIVSHSHLSSNKLTGIINIACIYSIYAIIIRIPFSKSSSSFITQAGNMTALSMHDHPCGPVENKTCPISKNIHFKSAVHSQNCFLKLGAICCTYLWFQIQYFPNQQIYSTCHFQRQPSPLGVGMDEVAMQQITQVLAQYLKMLFLP